MTAIEPHQKVGKAKVLARIYNKCFLGQKFRNPTTGAIYEWGLFGGTNPASIILPITSDRKVVAIRQFRHGADKIILELPSGATDNGESPLEAASRELLEETGYRAERIIPLSPQEIFIDQAGYNTNYFGFLGLGCARKQDPNLDENEEIEVVLLDLDDWISEMFNSPDKANSNLALTFLSLPHLGLFPRKEAR